MKKILSLVSGLMLLAPLTVGATGDVCGGQYVYEKGGDFSDSRVSINFESNSNQIDVSAQTGYEVIEVFLAVENDNHTGYWQYAYRDRKSTRLNSSHRL